MSTYKYPFIIKDSKQNMYKFSMNENNNLILEKFYENIMKTRIILRESIINFSVDIDDKDIIHIIYVDKNNRIKYSTYTTEFIDNKNFNIKDDDYDCRFLFFKFIFDRLYLFFITRPLSNTQCILKSCIIKNNSITIETILKVKCFKYVCPYFIYSTTNSIYVLFSKDSNEKYTLQMLETHKNKWHEYSNTVTLKKASHINFTVNNDTAFICYNSFQNNNMELHLASMNLKISSALVNEQILLSNTNYTSLYPLILTFQNHTSILWKGDEKITYFDFNHDKIAMIKKQYIPIQKSEIYYANYRSNFCETLKLNNTIAYTLNDNFLYIITDFQNIIRNEVKILSQNTSNEIRKDISNGVLKEISILEEISYDVESISFTPINVDFLEIAPYLNNYIKELYNSTTNTNELLSNYTEKNKKLKDDIDYLTRLNSSYKSRIEDLKNRLIKYRNDSATELMKYKNVIADTEEEKKKLTNIIGEKDTKILSLQHIINSHEK